MSRRARLGVWTAAIVIAAVAGLAVAGLPELGRSPDVSVVAVVVETTTTTEATTTTTAPTTTTTTVDPGRAPAEVTVRVASGTDDPALADRWTAAVAALGYATIAPAPGIPAEASQVWFQVGNDAEAATLATTLGIDPTLIFPTPFPSPIPPDEAHLILLVGPDLGEPDPVEGDE